MSDGEGQLVQVFASVTLLEKLDISSADHTVLINNGRAYGVICESAGEILKIDTSKQVGYTTVPLQAGFNMLDIVRVDRAGSTVAGGIDLVAW